MKKGCLVGFLVCTLASCDSRRSEPQFFVDTLRVARPVSPERDTDVLTHLTDTSNLINPGTTSADELVDFAETLLGTPYVWASSDPAVGFDCSGFITYVFTHFNIPVPRSSSDFAQVGLTIAPEHARRGDFILFTGTDPKEANIGHMGLVVSNDATGLRFIHATSGKAMGVTITPLNELYRQRLVRVSRIFLQDGNG